MAAVGAALETVLAVAFFCCVVAVCSGSEGDRTPYFHNCRENCEKANCSGDAVKRLEGTNQHAFHLTALDKAFLWTCPDVCQYECMWLTVHAFQERGWNVPQFYGKWPFVRFLGCQEPASVLFSLLNLIAHYRLLKKFKSTVRPDSPCFKLWHIFAYICINGWIWSTVFHIRDFPLTELLDYAFAYSIVLVILYCLIIRIFHQQSWILRALVTVIFLFYYLNYFAYLSTGKFSYAFNLKVNIATGILSAGGWFIWCYVVRKRRPYYRKVLRFYVLLGIAMSLELLDFSPILWILDSHALWHLATVAIVPIFYSFITDDCIALRTEKLGYSQMRKEI